MMCAGRTKATILLPFAITLGCEGPEYFAPRCLTAHSVDATISASEFAKSAYHGWMLPGEVGEVFLTPSESDPSENFFDPVEWCGQATFESSHPESVRIGRRTGPFRAELVGAGLGEARIVARYQDRTDEASIEVHTTPQPFESMRLDVTRPMSETYGTIDYESDRGRVISFTAPVNHSVAMTLELFRGGYEVEHLSPGITIQVEVADSSVLLGAVGCRPVSIDPTCGVVDDFWVVTSAPGTTDVTVRIRNLSQTFTVTVLEP